MARGVTFQVLDGIDKGRIFRDLSLPVTIGREEGNVLRLNDERVSRYHAKVQIDNNDFIITDLDSTNGTRVNGNVVQIRRLRYGDRVNVGRSLLLFGSNEEIAARMANLAQTMSRSAVPSHGKGKLDDGKTVQTAGLDDEPSQAVDFELDLGANVTLTRDALFIGNRALPPMPLKMTPSQAARFAEILDFLHQGLTEATANIQAKEDGTQVTLDYADWQKVLAVQMLLARYLRLIAEPPELEE
ncbi:MAG: FHA domain-containing protein [Gemmataceae bacterium]|nr:FHA domain-containing protein [Gemmataceae bacterium]